ncbi:hypothetical protein SAMN02745687_02540 [Lachnospiraceae bacterium NK3A20]|nr:hypothetical protein SAMN02745687_02540 [Lachnospiraceae bacterium NK3A20]
MAGLKRQGASGFFGCLSVIVIIAGIVATFICSSANAAYALSSLGAIVGLEIAAVLLALCALIVNGRSDRRATFGILPTLCSVIVLMLTIGRLINERILLISGLFSYNSQNTAGWQVFYITVAAVVLLLASVLCQIIGAFLAPHKSTKAAPAQQAGA